MKSNLDIAAMLLRIAREDQQVFLLLAQQGDAFLRQAFFHAQQSVEKAIKAVLTAKGFATRKTHDLDELYGNLEVVGTSCPVDLDMLSQLAPYAALFRYDDTDIPRLDRTTASLIVSRVMEWAAVHVEGQQPNHPGKTDTP